MRLKLTYTIQDLALWAGGKGVAVLKAEVVLTTPFKFFIEFDFLAGTPGRTLGHVAHQDAARFGGAPAG